MPSQPISAWEPHTCSSNNKKLTRFHIIEIRAGSNVHRRAVSRNQTVEYGNDPPVDDHEWHPVYQPFKKKGIAKLDGYDREPGQDKSDGDQLMKFKGLLDEIRRKHNSWHASLSRSHKIHLVDEGKKQGHGTYQTANAEYQNAIIY
jgi:hypothetical protein